MKKTALVTGASSGIGEATATRLAMAGYKVYGTSRRAGKAPQGSFERLPLDVTSDGSVEATVKEVLRLEGRIDLLVSNAGFGVTTSPWKMKVTGLQPKTLSDGISYQSKGALSHA
jgi:NAD(P)-dependent dehydrogenase (short-subunit alcohol dehydrogenase family)